MTGTWGTSTGSLSSHSVTSTHAAGTPVTFPTSAAFISYVQSKLATGSLNLVLHQAVNGGANCSYYTSENVTATNRPKLTIVYTVPTGTAPTAPTLNSATLGNAQVTLNWNVVTGATGYKIYYGTASGVYSAPITVGNMTTSTVTGLTNGTTYYFAVSATNTGGESVRSNEKSATPAAPMTENPTLFVKNVDYNASGQMTKVEYGNGDVTTYTYNALNLRLTRLSTVDKNGVALQDLNYTYDSVGNILSIVDNVNTADQTFKYDELNRLVEAANPNPGSYGTKSYTYDKIGNIAAKDGKTYFSGGTSVGPHAVTALSDGTAFTYDANGNMATSAPSGAFFADAVD